MELLSHHDSQSLPLFEYLPLLGSMSVISNSSNLEWREMQLLYLPLVEASTWPGCGPACHSGYTSRRLSVEAFTAETNYVLCCRPLSSKSVSHSRLDKRKVVPTLLDTIVFLKERLMSVMILRWALSMAADCWLSRSLGWVLERTLTRRKASL